MGLFDMGDIDWGQIASGMGTPGVPDFNARFNGQQPLPPMLPQPSMQSPISPEALASNAAARGVPPPPVDLAPGPPMRMPSPDAVQDWRNGVDASMGGKPGEVGAALTGQTAGPMDITSQAQKAGVAAQSGSTDVSAQSKDKSKLDKFAEALKGVQAPKSPELQRLSTPNAPRPTTQIKGGDIIALLQAMGQQAGGGTGYSLPSTLGAALRK